MVADQFRIVLTRMWARPRSTALTCAGVGIGTATLVFFANLTTSLAEAVELRLSALGAFTLTVSSQPPQGQRTTPLSFDDADSIRRSITFIRSVSPLVQFGGTVRACAEMVSAQIIAAGPMQHDLARHRASTGRLLSEIDLRRKRTVAVVSPSLAAKLSCMIRDDAHLFLQGRAYQVVGVLAGGASDSEAKDEVYVPLTTLQAQIGGRLEGAISMMIETAPDSPQDYVAGQIRNHLRRRHRLTEDDPDDFAIKTKDSVNTDAVVLSDQTKRILAVVVAWSLLIVGVGLSNSVLNSVLERIPQIGLQRAVGAKRRDIRIEYLLEAGCLAAVGALGGIIIGGAGSGIAAHALDLPQAFDSYYAAAAFGANVALGIVAGMWPAMHAARLDPAAAMRVE